MIRISNLACRLRTEIRTIRLIAKENEIPITVLPDARDQEGKMRIEYIDSNEILKITALIWLRAKYEIKLILINLAKQICSKTISYDDLAALVHAIHFDAHDSKLNDMLREISIEEYQAGRGLLSALVVHQEENYKPAADFFRLDNKIGEDGQGMDKDNFWHRHLNKVRAHWRFNQP